MRVRGEGGDKFVRMAIFPILYTKLCDSVPYRVSYGVANETREHEHPPETNFGPKTVLTQCIPVF